MFKPRSLRFWILLSLGAIATWLIATSMPVGGWRSFAQSPESGTAAEQSSSSKPSNGLRPLAEVTRDLTREDGLFTTYRDRDTNKAFLALQPNQLNRNFLLIATLESGVGEAGLFRGWPVNDLVFQFQEAPGDRLQIVVPNLYIRTPRGPGWQQRLRDTSFSDSVIYAVPLVSKDDASGTMLIDLSNLLMERDLANTYASLIGVLGSYAPNADLSYLDQVRAYPNNLEVGATLTFSGGGAPTDPLAGLLGASLRSLPDPRGFRIRLRYSFSALPTQNTYQPRPADERVGYFISAYRAPFQVGQPDPFVRYINRWHLEKQNPDAAVSPPKEPIVFWIENTVPPEYRDAIAQGTLMWNEAFEKAGFQNAIEVRQMPDNADWDPADVRYNVIRWSDSLSPWAIGLGPSRVNPLTGQILDADIILDANTIRYLQQQYQTRGLEAMPEAEQFLQFCGQRSQQWYLQWLTLQTFGEAGLDPNRRAQTPLQLSSPLLTDDHCAGYAGAQRTAFGALALSVLPQTDLTTGPLKTYINDYLAALTAHEVGHTLGLRHNFAGSRWLDPDQLNDPSVTGDVGMVSSVMDYFPPNIAPPEVEQGDFFPKRLGPYDQWAIEYGYRPVPQTPLQREAQAALDRIAARSTAPELAYATDEDIFDFIDPEVDAWDLSNNPLQFSIWQLKNARAVWDRLNGFSVAPGEGYGSLRRRVDLVFSYFRGNALTLTNYVGGQSFRRLNPWSAGGQLPLTPIPAQTQRAALAALSHDVFAKDAFQFSPQLLNQLAPDRWRHWGVSLTAYPLDYPIYDQILGIQSQILSELMYADRLARIRDLEFKARDEDVLTMAELYTSLHESVWTEVTTPADAPPAISSLRRGLQRHHLNILSNLVLRRNFWDALSAQSFMDFIALATTLGAPEDARVLARYQLRQIQQEASDTLRRHSDRLELTTRAHLEDVRDRVARVLEAPLIGS